MTRQQMEPPRRILAEQAQVFHGEGLRQDRGEPVTGILALVRWGKASTGVQMNTLMAIQDGPKEDAAGEEIPL